MRSRYGNNDVYLLKTDGHHFVILTNTRDAHRKQLSEGIIGTTKKQADPVSKTDEDL